MTQTQDSNISSDTETTSEDTFDTSPVGQVNRLLKHVCNTPIYLDNVLKACEVTNETLKQIVVSPVVVPPRRGRPPSAPERQLSNGKYNHKPLDPEYFKKYWQEKLLIHIECPRCGKLTGKGKISRHYKTLVCIKKTQALLDNLVEIAE
jgi:hypothetical protein